MQVVDPRKDIPKGLLGSLGIVTLLYVLMSATIVLMVPYTDINPKAAFAAAFEVKPHSLAASSASLVALPQPPVMLAIPAQVLRDAVTSECCAVSK